MDSTIEPSGPFEAGLLPRGKDDLGNDTLLFGDKPIRARFDAGPRPWLALPDVLEVCGLPSSTARKRLDIRGMSPTYPFKTPGGPQGLRTVDMDDAYRVAMWGKSEECKKFRDFIIEILHRLGRGEGIPATKPAPETAPAAGATALELLAAQASLLQQSLAAAVEQERRLSAAESKVEDLSRRLDRADLDRFHHEASLRALPAPTAAVREVTTIDRVHRLVRGYGGRTGDVGEAWRRLYEEIRLRLGYDAVARRAKYVKGTSTLDVVRTEGPSGVSLAYFHEQVYSIAYELFAAAVTGVEPARLPAPRPKAAPALAAPRPADPFKPAPATVPAARPTDPFKSPPTDPYKRPAPADPYVSARTVFEDEY